METITKKNSLNWRLGLSYFGYLLIGIIPLNVILNILVIYGNDVYKLMVILLYLIILPFWMKKLVITASALLMKRHHVVDRNQILVFTTVYFIVIWLILSGRRISVIDVVAITSIATEIYLISWFLFYSLKYLKSS